MVELRVKITKPDKKIWKITLIRSIADKKNRQVTYIAPLNHIPLLSSDPGGVLQELAV